MLFYGEDQTFPYCHPIGDGLRLPRAHRVTLPILATFESWKSPLTPTLSPRGVKCIQLSAAGVAGVCRGAVPVTIRMNGEEAWGSPGREPAKVGTCHGKAGFGL